MMARPLTTAPAGGGRPRGRRRPFPARPPTPSPNPDTPRKTRRRRCTGPSWRTSRAPRTSVPRRLRSATGKAPRSSPRTSSSSFPSPRVVGGVALNVYRFPPAPMPLVGGPSSAGGQRGRPGFPPRRPPDLADPAGVVPHRPGHHLGSYPLAQQLHHPLAGHRPAVGGTRHAHLEPHLPGPLAAHLQQPAGLGVVVAGQGRPQELLGVPAGHNRSARTRKRRRRSRSSTATVARLRSQS